jgi:hypothetical protein
MPFLIVHNVYSLISAFSNVPGSQWNPLYGSAAVLACMALLMEYFVVAIYIYIGLNISPFMSPDHTNLDSNDVPKATSLAFVNQEVGIVEKNYE